MPADSDYDVFVGRADSSFFIYEVGCPEPTEDPHGLICAPYLPVWVRQEYRLQVEIFAEAGVDLGFVGADACYEGVVLFEGFYCVTEALSLDASEEAVGAIVEVEDQWALAKVIAQPECLPVVAYGLEVRSLCTYL